jgi:O-antigen polymerase
MLSNLYTISKITAYERSKKPDINLLIGIVNPLVFQDRFDFHLTYFRLSLAKQTNNQQEVQEVIKWSKEKLQTTPKPFFYILLYLAYQQNNQPEQAQQLLHYARYLYPRDLQLTNIDKPATSQAEKTSNNTHSSAQVMD